jgi:hypothetical protein
VTPVELSPPPTRFEVLLFAGVPPHGVWKVEIALPRVKPAN